MSQRFFSKKRKVVSMVSKTLLKDIGILYTPFLFIPDLCYHQSFGVFLVVTCCIFSQFMRPPISPMG